MRALVLACVAATGCGRLAFDPLASSDGGGTDDGSFDAAPLCTTWSAWSTPTPVAIPSSNSAHYMGMFSEDELVVVYANYTDGTNLQDLYMASRSTPASALGNEALISELQNADNDYAPVTRDGLTIYFAKEIGGMAPNIYVTTRPNLGAMFSTPAPVPSMSTAFYEAPGWISPDGLRLYIATDATTADVDIYLAERATTASAWGTPAPIPELSLNAFDTHPVLTTDEREIIWSSRPTAGRYDLYHATRATRLDPFGSPAPIAELSSANDDAYASVSADGTTMYFNYNFLTSGGAADVYKTTRTCQ